MTVDKPTVKKKQKQKRVVLLHIEVGMAIFVHHKEIKNKMTPHIVVCAYTMGALFHHKLVCWES